MRVEPLGVLEWILQFLALSTEEKVAYAAGGIARTPSDCAPAFGFARPPLEEIAAAYSDFMIFVDRVRDVNIAEVSRLASNLKDSLEPLFFAYGSLPWSEQGLDEMTQWCEVRHHAEVLLEHLRWPKTVPSVPFRDLVGFVGD